MSFLKSSAMSSLFKGSAMFVISRGYILLISSCPLNKVDVFAPLFQNYLRGKNMVAFYSTEKKFC